VIAPAASPAPAPATADQRRVLVVDDDPTVLEIVCRYVRAAGYLVDEAQDGLSALRLAEEKRPDLVVLDRMLPLLDGIEVCRRVRSTWAIPVIMLTALNQEDDRIDGLEAGADDYLAKPFSPRELVLRVRAVLRRTRQEAGREAGRAPGQPGDASDDQPVGPLTIGDFTLDTAAHEIRLHTTPLVLTVREFHLLSHLLRHPHTVLGREDLLRSVWGWEFGDLSTVTVHVRRLREKIEADPAHPLLLQTVWGVGYRFDPVPLGSVPSGPVAP
jgi:DNA-binding response OmpR family regulator